MKPESPEELLTLRAIADDVEEIEQVVREVHGALPHANVPGLLGALMAKGHASAYRYDDRRGQFDEVPTPAGALSGLWFKATPAGRARLRSIDD